MSEKFTCEWCYTERPVALMFYARTETICLWCAEDNGLATKRFTKGY